jgi:DNA modification methylase
VPKLPLLEAGVLYCNDNLDRLAQLPAESVDLIYLDPPFFSNRVYEVIWGDEAEVRSFEDRWEGGIQHYIGWMKARVVEMHRVLKPTGSIYLHCDPSASHYLKVMLDDIFGIRRFRNEIVWERSGAKNDPKRFGRSHDSILYYTKSATFTWHTLYEPFRDASITKNYTHVEEGTGRRYRRGDLTANKGGGDTDFEWHGVRPYRGRHWAYSRENLDRMFEEGRIEFRRTGMPVYKRYLDEQPGVPLQDVWVGIRLASADKERLGYPTQKPEALLERIIQTSSNPGDVVLDPFCGCGTSVAVAERLRRSWIGIDISPTAMEIMRRRLWNQSRTVPVVVDVPDTEDALKQLKPFEFQNWVINALNGTHSPRRTGDMGIDGYWFFTKDPIQVKQSERVGRNVVDNFQTAMRRAGNDTGYIVAFSFTKGAVEEVARARTEGLDIKLVRVKEVLLQVRRGGNPMTRLGPQPEGDVLPLPPMRKPSDLPSAEELVASAQAG